MFYPERFQNFIFFGCYQIVLGYDNISPVDHPLSWCDTFYASFNGKSRFSGIVFQVRVDVVVQAQTKYSFLGGFVQVKALDVFN